MSVELASSKKEILAKVKKLKTDGKLPTRYAKVIREKYPQFDSSRIHKVANGLNYNAEIVDAILELAEDAKIESQLERLEKLNED